MAKKKDILLSFFDGFEMAALDMCWLWKKSIQGDGYGSVRGKLAHRISYEVFNAPIPQGLEIDHLCRNRACVNPDHLEAVSHAENVRRGEARKKFLSYTRSMTHCRKGHIYDEKNTHIVKRKTCMGKKCRACENQAYHKRKNKK